VTAHTALIVKAQEKNRRPKLLFLACPFPPLRAVACVRTWNIAKHLARLGWEVTVVTPHSSIYRNPDKSLKLDVEVEKEGIKRIFTEHRWRFLRPQSLICWDRGLGWILGGCCRRVAQWLQVDKGVGWVKAAESACASLTPDDVDVILVTGSPFSSFKLAKRLSDRIQRPYVLDYRDPWTEKTHTLTRARLRVIKEEKRLLADCAAALIVSHSWAKRMDDRFGIGAKVHVITNGYDAEEMATIKPHDFGHFAIVYTGSLYPPKRVITPLMAALKGVKEITQRNSREWRFHYYGKQENHVREEAGKYGVLDRVVLHGKVPRAEALSAVRGAAIAVVITSIEDRITDRIAGMIPAKLFEILGLQTAALIVGPPGGDIDAIADTTSQAHRFEASDLDGMKSFILRAMSSGVSESTNTKCYAWDILIEKVNDILREVADMAARKKQSHGTNSVTTRHQPPLRASEL
jgi:glycosyltransferase involved in cell wall biosynthesis